MKNNHLKSLTFLLAILFITSSCKKDPIPPTSLNCEEAYILFGHFYGECLGEGCIEIFRICEEKLYEDSNDKYPSSQAERYDGDFQELFSQENYEAVKSLIDQMPNDLFNESEKVIGMPDAGDWGGFYIEVKREGEDVQFWLIDTMKDNLPIYLRDYTDDIAAAIELING